MKRDIEGAEKKLVLFVELKQSYTDYLSNLATDARSYRASVVALTETIMELTKHIAYLTSKSVTASQTIIALLNRSQRGNNTLQGSNNGGGSNNRRNIGIFDQNVYCSTHGFKVTRGHMHLTCNTCVPNHYVTATWLDTNNGCQLKKVGHKEPRPNEDVRN